MLGNKAMSSSDLVELKFAYEAALIEAREEYQEHGTFHVDMCNCSRCQALEKWLDLPWYLKLKANLFALITYGI